MEAIPRRMRIMTPAAAQVRISRDKVESLMQLLAAGRPQPAPDAVVGRLISVRLKAPDGGFAIEAETPEAQWVEAQQEDHVGWRWTVTPLQRGRHRLQLAVAARTVARDGVGPETAPPDRIIEVAVRPRRLRGLMRWMGLALLIAAGVGMGRLSQDKLAQDIVDVASAIWKNLMGLLVTSGFVVG
jgi:hypothetical protein